MSEMEEPRAYNNLRKKRVRPTFQFVQIKVNICNWAFFFFFFLISHIRKGLIIASFSLPRYINSSSNGMLMKFGLFVFFLFSVLLSLIHVL